MNVVFSLRQARNFRELSVEEAAEKIGVSVSTLYSWEQGNSYPNTKNIPKILETYNMTIADISFTQKLG